MAMDRLRITTPPAQHGEARGAWLAQALSIILTVPHHAYALSGRHIFKGELRFKRTVQIQTIDAHAARQLKKL